MTQDLWLFAVCHPWMVAVPVTAVERVLAADEVPPSLLVTPLSRPLGLRPQVVGGVVVIRHAGRQAALGVDRCLQVGPLPPGGFAIPGGALRQPRAWSCFPVPSGQRRDSLAAFGLALDPVSLVMTP